MRVASIPPKELQKEENLHTGVWAFLAFLHARTKICFPIAVRFLIFLSSIPIGRMGFVFYMAFGQGIIVSTEMGTE